MRHAAMGYTLAEASERTGPEWLAILPKIERELRSQVE